MLDMPTILPIDVLKTKFKIVNNIAENTVWDIKNFSLNGVFEL